MNILIISSSPRKGGNSEALCDEFMRGAHDSGHAVERIALRDRKINYCLGCMACASTKKCVQKDDMSELLFMMTSADVIVFASPLYFYTVTGQLKTFIDRCAPRYTDIANKEFYYLFTCSDDDPSVVERAITELSGFMECLENPRVKGYVAGTGVTDKGDILDKIAMQEAYKLGRLI